MCPRCDNLGRVEEVPEVKTVPLTFGDKVIGEADVQETEAGIHVMTTRITDPTMRRMLEISIGPMSITIPDKKE